MHRELPLYIFIRNSIVLCFAFFIISSVIIERGRQERGENSLINMSIIKKDDIRDYNNFNLTKSQEAIPFYEYSNFSTASDSITKYTTNPSFSGVLVDNKFQSFTASNQVDL